MVGRRGRGMARRHVLAVAVVTSSPRFPWFDFRSLAVVLWRRFHQQTAVLV